MIRIKQVKGIVVFSSSGEFTEEDVVKVKNLLAVRIEQDHRRFIINLTRARRVPMNAVGVLMDGLRRLRAIGGDLRIAGLRDSLKRLFDEFHVSDVLGFYPNERQALRSFDLRKETA